jgi:uncharacterized alkaline shock family protein YloU
MSDPTSFTGRTTIAPDVLVAIVKLTVNSVPGVSRLAPVPGRVNRIFKREAADGVEISVENNTVYADVYVVFKRDVNVRDVSRSIQYQIARAVKEMVGMEVGKVNVHVEDIDYRSENES